MNEYIFKVQGSKPKPYTVICQETEDSLTLECNCQAGSFGKLCKHKKEIVHEQIAKSDKLFINYYGTIFQELTTIEISLKKLKSEEKKAKKLLESLMKGV